MGGARPATEDTNIGTKLHSTVAMMLASPSLWLGREVLVGHTGAA